jgi:hypothetical protein
MDKVYPPGVIPNKGTMDIMEFSSQLIHTKDLDPIYNMMHNSGVDLSTKKRWVLAYSCFYNAGVASFISEDPKRFWKRLRKGHELKWPRGAERRHFRGGTSDYVTEWLPKNFGTPEEAMDFLIGEDEGRTFKAVSGRVKKWKYFGDWIAFKMADLIERVVGHHVDFSDCDMGIYDAPKQGAALVAQFYGRPEMSVGKVIRVLNNKLSHFPAPPTGDRQVNVQEIETCLCKWKSHTNGHYAIGKDTHEIREGLEGWGDLACLSSFHTAVRTGKASEIK